MHRYLIVGIPLFIVCFALLHFFSSKRRLVFILLSCIPLMFIIYRLIDRVVNGYPVDYILQAIPFQICGLSSIFIIVAAITKNKLIFNMIYFITMPATIFACILDNTYMQPWNVHFWAFVVPHLMYLFLPVLMLYFKYMRPQVKMLKWVLAGLICVIALMHGVNLLFSVLFPVQNGITTNYVFTMFPGDSSGPPDFVYIEFMLLKQAYAILPVKGLYLVLLLPILAVVWSLLSIPLIVIDKRRLNYNNAARLTRLES